MPQRFEVQSGRSANDALQISLVHLISNFVLPPTTKKTLSEAVQKQQNLAFALGFAKPRKKRGVGLFFSIPLVKTQ